MAEAFVKHTVKKIERKMINKIKKFVKKKMFLKNAIVGRQTKFDECSSCINLSRDKKKITIGNDCCIRGIVKINENGTILIGNNTYIGGNSIIGSAENITIGNAVIISTEVHIYDNNNHPISPVKRKRMCECGDFFGKEWQWSESAHSRIVIEDNVWIGERATVLKGVTIGEGAIIASNSVVTHDVPPFTIAAGNPARVVKSLENDYEEK